MPGIEELKRLEIKSEWRSQDLLYEKTIQSFLYIASIAFLRLFVQRYPTNNLKSSDDTEVFDTWLAYSVITT